MSPKEQRHADGLQLDPWRRGPMTVGVLLGGMFHLSRRTWRPFTTAVGPIALATFLIANLLNNAPLRALQAKLQSGHVSPSQLTATTFLIPVVDGAAFVEILGGVLMLGAGLWVIGCGERAEAVRASAAVDIALRRFLPLLAVTLLVEIGVMLGLVLVIIPGIVLATLLALAPAAVVLEGARPLRAIARSWKLIASHFWRSLGVLALGVVVIAVVGVIVGAVANAVLALLTAPFGSLGGPIAAAVSDALFYVIAASLGASLVVLLYADLRNRAEGFDLTLPSAGPPDGFAAPWGSPPAW